MLSNRQRKTGEVIGTSPAGKRSHPSEQTQNIPTGDGIQGALAKKRDGNRNGVITIGKCILGTRAKGSWKFSLAVLRVREIEKIIASRHGRILPETDDAVIYVEAVAGAKSDQDIAAWCTVFCPWFSEAEIAAIESQAEKRKRMQGADAVAHDLRVCMEERTALGLRTIGAFDVDQSTRKKLMQERKRERDRTRMQVKRAADHGGDNAGSITEIQPWKAAGISRATWYRRVRQNPSRIDIYTKGDTFVSRSDRGKFALAKPAHLMVARAMPLPGVGSAHDELSKQMDIKHG
jgi:hypothetical protein